MSIAYSLPTSMIHTYCQLPQFPHPATESHSRTAATDFRTCSVIALSCIISPVLYYVAPIVCKCCFRIPIVYLSSITQNVSMWGMQIDTALFLTALVTMWIAIAAFRKACYRAVDVSTRYPPITSMNVRSGPISPKIREQTEVDITLICFPLLSECHC